MVVAPRRRGAALVLRRAGQVRGRPAPRHRRRRGRCCVGAGSGRGERDVCRNRSGPRRDRDRRVGGRAPNDSDAPRLPAREARRAGRRRRRPRSRRAVWRARAVGPVRPPGRAPRGWRDVCRPALAPTATECRSHPSVDTRGAARAFPGLAPGRCLGVGVFPGRLCNTFRHRHGGGGRPAAGDTVTRRAGTIPLDDCAARLGWRTGLRGPGGRSDCGRGGAEPAGRWAPDRRRRCATRDGPTGRRGDRLSRHDRFGRRTHSRPEGSRRSAHAGRLRGRRPPIRVRVRDACPRGGPIRSGSTDRRQGRVGDGSRVPRARRASACDRHSEQL
jgi:hypothetical protein